MARLLLVIIDGICSATLECAHVRCLDRLASKGVFYSNLRPVAPRLTLPTVTTLITSLPPARHGVLSDAAPGRAPDLTASIFSLLRYRNLESAMFHSRATLRYLAPAGALSTALLINSHGLRNVDPRLARAAARCLQREHPDFCLLCLEGADVAGTHFGYMSSPYLESVEQADLVLDLLLDQMRMVGLDKEYAVMVLSTQAGSWEVHAEGEPAALSGLPLIVAGTGVGNTGVISAPVSMLDLAPTIARLLAIPPHPDWQGRVLREIVADRQGRHHRPAAGDLRKDPPLTASAA